MFDDLVLGVDPGTASVGLAVVGRGGGRPSVRWAGTLRTPAGLRPEARLPTHLEQLLNELKQRDRDSH